MKVNWEQADIVVGRIVTKEARKERWMIGYRAELGGENRYTLNSLSDGMVTSVMTKAELAEHLNAGRMLPIEIVEPANAA